MPGIATSARRVSASSAPGSGAALRPPPGGDGEQAFAARARERKGGRIRFGEGRPRGKTGGSGRRRSPPPAPRSPRPCGRAPCARRHRDLLAHDRPRGHLEAVDRAGHTHSGRRRESGEQPVAPELGVDRTRIGASRPNRRLQRSAASPASSWSSSPSSQRTPVDAGVTAITPRRRGGERPIGAVVILHARDRAAAAELAVERQIVGASVGTPIGTYGRLATSTVEPGRLRG